MQDIINWIIGNWETLLSCITCLILLASLIVSLTTTTKDDGVVAKIIEILDKFSIVKTARDKALIEYAKEQLEKKKNK